MLPSSSVPGAFELRWRPERAGPIWMVWLLLAGWITWPYLLENLEVFRERGRAFYFLAAFSFPASALVLWAYQKLRQRLVWRYEPAAIAGLVLLVGLTCQTRGTLVLIWFSLAAYVTGRFALEKLSLDLNSLAERVALPWAAGSAALLLSLIGIGLAGGFYAWTFVIVFSAPIIFLRKQIAGLGRVIRETHDSWGTSDVFRQPLAAITICCTATFALFSFVVALTPTLHFDGMAFHISAARYFANEHVLEPVPYILYSFYPQGLEVLMAACYSLGGLSAAQLVNTAAFGCTALLMWGVLRLMHIERPHALVGIGLAATVPFIHWSGSVLKNDLLMACFQTASLYCYLRGRAPERRGWPIMGAALLGASFSVKHVALFGGIPLALLYMHDSWRRRSWSHLFLLGGLVLLFGTPLTVRTFTLTGSPIYPARPQWAAQPLSPVDLSDRPATAAESYFHYPWMMHFQGPKVFALNIPTPSGILLVLFWPLWWLARRRAGQQTARRFWFFCAVYFLYWGYVWGILRYAIVPLMGIFAMTGARAAAFTERSPVWLRRPIQGAVLATFVFSAITIAPWEVNPTQLEFLTLQIDEKEYMRRAIRFYPPLEYLEAHRGPEDRILSVDNPAVGYSPRPGWMNFTWMSSSRPESVARRLRREPYRHLILPTERAQLYLPGVRSLHGAQLGYRDEHFSVYHLGPAR